MIFADRIVIARVSLLHAADGRHDLARRAIAALEGVVVDEGLLHGMQRSVGARQPFDGGDLMALRRHRQRQARKDAHAVDRAPCRRRTGRDRSPFLIR